MSSSLKTRANLGALRRSLHRDIRFDVCMLRRGAARRRCQSVHESGRQRLHRDAVMLVLCCW